MHAHHTDVLELDIHATKDGQVVVSHDSTVERCTDGNGPISGFLWSELKKLDAGYCHTPVGALGLPWRGQGVRIPLLREVLTSFPSTRVNVDLKGLGVLEPFITLMRSLPCRERVCAGSEHDTIAASLSSALPGACLFYPGDAATAFVLAVRGGQRPPEDERYTVLDMPMTYEGTTVFDSTVARVARQHGRWVNVWTVDDPAQMRAAIADKVDGIMTDRPDVLRTVIDERRRAGRSCGECARPL